MTQQQKVGYALCVIGGLVIGFFAGVQYVQYRMVSAFAEAASAFAGGISGKSTANSTPRDEAKPEVDKFKGIEISDAKLGAELPMYGPPLLVTVTNNGEHVVSGVEFACEVSSPERAVPWATCREVRTSVDGGIEPGEWRVVEAYSHFGMQAVADALKVRKGARLVVKMTDVQIVERP